MLNRPEKPSSTRRPSASSSSTPCPPVKSFAPRCSCFASRAIGWMTWSRSSARIRSMSERESAMGSSARIRRRRRADAQHTRSAVARELVRVAQSLGFSRQRVLVAASGGLDSTVLAHGLATAPRRLRIEVALGHVHHGLRGAEADADAEAVAALAAKLGVPVDVRRVDPRARRAGGPCRGRPTLQEAARELRYAALREMAREMGASRIATAHHADDQAETVLLRLLRGTGPDGLAGIPERSSDGVLVRPLLRIPRDALCSYAEVHGLAWREDSSNTSPR